MKKVRSAILYLSVAIGLWVIVSFAGAMFNSANSALWSKSLMWSLLSFLVIMPALVVVNHASLQQSAQRSSAPPSEPASPEAQEQKSFVREDSEGADTIWPETETDWPRTQEESSGSTA